MTHDDDIPPERLVTMTSEEVEAWAASDEGREAQARLAERYASMTDEDIDFSDIPEMTGGDDAASRVERLLDEVGDDPAALVNVLDAVTRRLRAATAAKASQERAA